MLGALNWSVQWFRPDGPQTATEIAEGLADYLIQGLLSRQDSRRRPLPDKETRRAIGSQIRQVPKKRASARRSFQEDI
jgi:hypothetical protein